MNFNNTEQPTPTLRKNREQLKKTEKTKNNDNKTYNIAYAHSLQLSSRLVCRRYAWISLALGKVNFAMNFEVNFGVEFFQLESLVKKIRLEIHLEIHFYMSPQRNKNPPWFSPCTIPVTSFLIEIVEN